MNTYGCDSETFDQIFCRRTDDGEDPFETWLDGIFGMMPEQRSDVVTYIGPTEAAPPPPLSPDAHSVRFSEMTAEAEAEWDRILHGRTP